jgi:hypothetical protein
MAINWWIDPSRAIRRRLLFRRVLELCLILPEFAFRIARAGHIAQQEI